MREITTIVTHHGADARKLTLAEMKRIYQETHYKNLYLKYDQPRSRSEKYPDIAYHALIGTDGWEYMRDFDIPGYHASNYPVNLESVAVVISGNYDRDKLSKTMDGYYREVIADLRENFPSITKNTIHRNYANKSCPGKNITNDYVQDVFHAAAPIKTNKEVALHIGAAIEDLSKAIKAL